MTRGQTRLRDQLRDSLRNHLRNKGHPRVPEELCRKMGDGV
jgi:hypothetical protein